MIARLLSPSTGSTCFSAERLPEAVHGPILKTVMTPIVQSESMVPTIQRGDKLELENATELKVGDVVVFRYDQFFICHRIHRIDDRRVFLRGDASTGPLDEVDIRSVVGRVRFLVRDGTRLPVPLLFHTPISRAGLAWTRTITGSAEHGKWFVLKFIQWIGDLPGISQAFRIILRTFMTIEIMERASLHSIDGYVFRQRLHLADVERGRHDRASLHDKNMVLVVRLGPIRLGTCTLAPWSIHLRPFLRSQATDIVSESLTLLQRPHPPYP